MFSKTSWVLKNALISSIVIVRNTFEPLQIIPWCLSHSIMREKKVNSLCHEKIAFFLKYLVLDLLGPKEMIKSLAHYLSEKHVCPYDLFHDICLIRYYERKYATIFFPENFTFFSKTCVLNNLLGVTQMLLWLPKYLSEKLSDQYNLSADSCHSR